MTHEANPFFLLACAQGIDAFLNASYCLPRLWQTTALPNANSTKGGRYLRCESKNKRCEYIDQLHTSSKPAASATRAPVETARCHSRLGSRHRRSAHQQRPGPVYKTIASHKYTNANLNVRQSGGALWLPDHLGNDPLAADTATTHQRRCCRCYSLQWPPLPLALSLFAMAAADTAALLPKLQLLLLLLE